jgi:hypothetical protein
MCWSVVQCLAASLLTLADAYEMFSTSCGRGLGYDAYIVALLIELVGDRVLGGSGTGGEGGVRVFSDLLVGG